MTLTTPQPQPSPHPHPLTYPPLTHAKLAPRSFLTAHLAHPTHGPSRPSSNRHPSQTRPPTINTGSLTHANGSAVVRCGDTAVVCGVRAEVLRVADVVDYDWEKEGEDEEEGDGRRRKRGKWKRESDQMAKLDLLVPNIELATGCSPANLPGGPPSVFAQTLTQRVLTLLYTSLIIPFGPLKIWSQPPHPCPPTFPPSSTTKMQEQEEDNEEAATKPRLQAFWTLYIDILFISLDGNAFDAAWLSLLAALKDTLLPRAWWDEDREMVVCSDEVEQAVRLGGVMRGWVVPVSFGVFGEGEGDGDGEGRKGDGNTWILLDPDAFEESLCQEHGTVVVGDQGRIIRLEKSGGGKVGMLEMRALVEAAAKRREEWLLLLRVQK